MHTYRSTESKGVEESWPGMREYAIRMTGLNEPHLRIRRECQTGEIGQRRTLLEELILQ